MKTPIQELIEFVGLHESHPMVKILLEKEKKEIMDAFYEAGYTANRWQGSTMNTTAEDYYRNKFKK